MIKSDFVWSQNCSFRIDEHIIVQISIKQQQQQQHMYKRFTFKQQEIPSMDTLFFCTKNHESDILSFSQIKYELN